MAKLLGAVCLALGLAAGVSSAKANVLQTYDVEWSGAALGNSATASGLVTFDLTLLPNPGGCTGACLTLSPYITALSISVSGSSAGNGAFGLSDFSMLSWSTGGSTLDMTKQLVGQPTSILPWGTQCQAANQSKCGDFNLYSLFAVNGTGNPLAPTASPTPSGIAPFLLDTGGGDRMFLTSFAPVAPTPLPAALPLFATGLSAMGLFGWWRKRKAQAAA